MNLKTTPKPWSEAPSGRQQGLVQLTRQPLQPIHLFLTQKHQRKHRLIVPQGLIEIDPFAARLPVRGPRQRGKLRQHDPDADFPGEVHRLLHLLLIAGRVAQ